MYDYYLPLMGDDAGGASARPDGGNHVSNTEVFAGFQWRYCAR